MLHIVAAPVLLAAQAQQPVVSYCARQGDLRPSVVVSVIPFQDSGIAHDRAQHALAQSVGNVGVSGVGEIPFHNMAHHVADAVGHLVFRQSEIKLRIHNAEHRTKNHVSVGQLQLRLLIGDNGSVAGFAAGGGQSQNGGNRQGSLDRLAGCEEIPHVAVIGHAHGDGLSGINDASSAYGQNKADAFPAAELNTLMDQGQPGIRLNASQFHKGNARFPQGGGYPVVEAAFFDASPAVVEKNLFGVGLDQGANLGLGSLAEDDARFVGVIKV